MARCCTRQPAGSHVHIPAPICRISPARTINLCEIASASAGGSFSVGSRYSDRRVIDRSSSRLQSARRGYRSQWRSAGRVTLSVSPPLIEQRSATVRRTLDKEPPDMAFSVPPLPYAYDALEPHIDKATMEFHHDKHHQAYVDKANAALEGTEWAEKPVEEVLKNLGSLPSEKTAPVRNNGGGHYNHTLFWQSMSPTGG